MTLLGKKCYLGWLTKFLLRFCIKSAEKNYFHFFNFLFTFQMPLFDGNFLLKKITSLDYAINKSVLLSVGV